MKACKVTFACGEYQFELDRSWAKWSADLKDCGVSGIVQSPKDGLIYASVRSEKYPICVFNTEGSMVRGFGAELNFARTHGLTIDQEGNIWICDDPNSVIYHLSPEGELLGTMGEKGRYSDNGYDPTVRWPHDIYTITRAGEPFNRPTRIVQAPWGDLYCSDGYGNAAIHRFDSSGNLIRTWGGPGREPGQLRLPHDIAIAADERLWICDRENFMVQIYDKEGNYVTRITKEAGYPSQIWASDTEMFLCDADGQVSIFTIEGTLITQIGYPGCFYGIHSIGGDREGNLYLGRINGPDTLFKLKKIK